MQLFMEIEKTSLKYYLETLHTQQKKDRQNNPKQ